VLLANDWVNALDIDSSREEAIKTGKRHGEVLVARGLLTPDQLHSALAAQHTTNLLTLLSLTDGKYDWRGWEPPPAWAREVLVAPLLAGAVEPQPGSQAQPADDLPSTPDEDLALAPAPPERQKRLDEREAIARLDALSLDDAQQTSGAPADEEEELELDLPA